MKMYAGVAISLFIMISCLYIAFIFFAVWKIQNSAYIYATLGAIVFDLIIMELAIEGVIAMFYSCRKGSASAK